MKAFVAICVGGLVLGAPAAGACELPVDPSHYVAMRAEERELTRQALARSDSVFVGTVRAIRHGPEQPDPGDRVSEVTVDVDEVLTAPAPGPASRVLTAHLHHTIVGCFGNEAFWDDNVDVDGEYLFFVADGRILAATETARSANRLGLQGQREVVRHELE